MGWLSSILGSWGGGTGSIIPVDAPPAPAKPQTGVVTGDYPVADAGGYGGGYSLGGLSGYGARPASSITTYLSCLTDPVLAAARMYALGPIKVGKPSVAKREDAKPEWVEFVEKVCPGLWGDYAADATWAVDLGWAGWQVVWDRQGGKYVPTRLIPCRQEYSGVLVDEDTGDYAGLRWEGADLYGEKCFVFTHDRRARNYVGRSRLENVIDAVWNWRDANNNTAKLAKKQSGTIATIGFPPGTAKVNGQTVSRAKQADDFGKVITNGAGYVTYPLLSSMTEEDLKRFSPSELAALLEKSLWKIGTMDLGDHGPAIGAITADKQYLDELKCLGYGVPPEAILQGSTGNRAKAGTMSGNATTMNEPVNRDIAKAFNKGLVNSLLTLNFGPDAADAVWYEPEPLEDPQAIFDQQLIQAYAAAKGGAGDDIYKRFDIDAIMERNGVAKRAQPLEDPPPPATPQPGSVPPANGENGQADPLAKRNGAPPPANGKPPQLTEK